jgi:ABC-2 type transport system permease protein
MKFWAVFRKSMRKQLREPLILSLTLVFAPFFILLYRLWLPSGSTAYTILVLDQDRPVQHLSVGADSIRALQAVTYKDGLPLLSVRPVSDRAAAEKLLRDRRAAALIVFPPGLSAAVAALALDPAAPQAEFLIAGDLSNPQYAVAAVMASAAVDATVQTAAGRTGPLRIVEEAIGASATRTEFENYVPGLMVFAVIMLIFQSAMLIAREVEAGTLRRLILSRVRTAELLAGISAAQVLVGVFSVALTFAAAYALGFRSLGPLWLALLVGAVTALSVVGMGLVVACFARTVTQAFLVANFPLALLMFFSGAVYPVPKVPLFTLGSIEVGLYDLLPATHAVTALNKVLALGSGLGDVVYELSALLILSLLYFSVGVWLFQRTQMRRGG